MKGWMKSIPRNYLKRNVEKDFEKPATMKSGANGSKWNIWNKTSTFLITAVKGLERTQNFFLCNFRITTEIKTVWKKLN